MLKVDMVDGGISKGFTLIELMVTTVISSIVIFFIYNIMVFSFESYKRLSTSSENEGDIRAIYTNLKNAFLNINSEDISSSSNYFQVAFVDTDYSTSPPTKKEIKEKYCLTDNRFNFTDQTGLSYGNTIKTNLESKNPTAGRVLLYKEVYENNALKNKVLLSNSIRDIYLTRLKGRRYTTFFICILYDQITGGKIELKKKVFCFSKRKII